jgi:transcriptional regulator with GAF, ATPase, and Fis domain
MSISRSQMEDILGNALDEMEKYSKLVNLDLRNSEMLSNATKWSSKSSEEKDESGQPLFNEDLDKSEELLRQENVINAIQEITDAILEGATLNQILVMVMETIYTSFNFTRVMFCLINKSRTSINARFGFGSDVETLTQRLSIPVGGKDAFSRALNEHKDLIIEDIKTSDAEEYLPKWYRDEFAKKSMIVFPIVVKNIPMGLIYVDSVAPISLHDENRLSTIKTLRNQVVLAIKQSSS